MDMTKIDLAWANMIAGIEAQEPYLREAPFVLYEQLKRLAISERPSRVYLTGCGDSWYCGMATRFAFEEWAGIATEPSQAMEFSRYLVHHAPTDALVVAISNSGRVSRTIEAVKRADQRGIETLAGTADMASGIARAARFAVDLGYAERRFAPGTSSYLASLVLLYCLAVRLGELGGRLGPAAARAKLEEISELAQAMRETIAAQRPLLEELGAPGGRTDQ